MGSGVMTPTVPVSNTTEQSPVTHSLPPQPQPQYASAALIWRLVMLEAVRLRGVGLPDYRPTVRGVNAWLDWRAVPV